jgi:hypothetical protein
MTPLRGRASAAMAHAAEAAMAFRISRKDLDVSEALRERISARIGEATSKYFDGGYSGHVTVEREGSGFRTECAIHLDSKVTLRGEGSAPDAYERRPGGAVCGKAAAPLSPPAQGSPPLKPRIAAPAMGLGKS